MTKQALVIGATGNVGRHVVSQLHHQGVPVRALSRGVRAADVPPGVEPFAADVTDAAALAAALDGVDRVFLVWRGRPVPVAEPVVAAIAGAATHLTLLSSAVVRDDGPQPDAIAELHAGLEGLVTATDLEWTFLRPAQFATNTLEWAAQLRLGDEVHGAYGDAPTTVVHERDIAAVAVQAMTGHHHGRRYVLTGPEIHTPAGLVAVIGEVLGRDLRWVEDSVEDERRRMLGWMPAAFVDVVLAGRARARQEGPFHTTTVQDVLGVPARTYHEWVKDHAADLA
ncbi:NAD(P)H-binding protein [Dactylosporangium sp. McL0621]|uniref:NAD(P)H-binding protein n=1 Tax=Dactylosporangium sp. McL0621 TaxID=3415678 RepID=UPI003CE77171